MAAIRAGNVAVANAIGNGVADDKGVYPYIPDLISYYFNEEPILPNATTYTLWEADQREHVLSRLDELVVKPVAEAGGYGIVIGNRASEEELADCAAAIEEVVSLPERRRSRPERCGSWLFAGPRSVTMSGPRLAGRLRVPRANTSGVETMTRNRRRRACGACAACARSGKGRR